MPEPNFKQPRVYDAVYLAYVRTLPCCVCGMKPAEPHHPRVASLEHGASHVGMGTKASDRWAVPLCRRCHEDVHRGEREFWASVGINPFTVAMSIRMPDE